MVVQKAYQKCMRVRASECSFYCEIISIHLVKQQQVYSCAGGCLFDDDGDQIYLLFASNELT